MASPEVTERRSLCDRWESPWGLESSDMPDKDELFHSGNTQALEDYLQHNGVFVSSVDGKPRHSDSYGTLLHYERATAAITLLQGKVKPEVEEWLPILRVWLECPNMTPPLRLFAAMVARVIGVEWSIFKIKQPTTGNDNR